MQRGVIGLYAVLEQSKCQISPVAKTSCMLQNAWNYDMHIRQILKDEASEALNPYSTADECNGSRVSKELTDSSQARTRRKTKRETTEF